MKYIDEYGKTLEAESVQDKFLRLLYTRKMGRFIVKFLINPLFSKAVGLFLSSALSKFLIKPFIRMYNIDISACEKKYFQSYNDFFTRKLKASARIIDRTPDSLISPCDANLSVYSIDEKKCFQVKNTLYTAESLLKSKKLAKQYQGGYVLLFRLTVKDYHRYCYIDDGYKSSNTFIKGVLHTVNPIANDVEPIYKQNCREYSILDTENFGKVLVMEVGALLVGKIVNYDQAGFVKRGQEKGRFEFGGSTIILLFQKDRIELNPDLIRNTKNGAETIVKMGEKIGCKSRQKERKSYETK